MRVILGLILWVAVVFSGQGQSLDLSQEGSKLVIKNSGSFRLEYLEPKDFQKLDWQHGYAYYLDGSSRKFDGMKYDPSKDLIQVSTKGHVLTLLPGVVNGVSMEAKGTVSRIFVKVPLDKPVFMEALSVGRIHLLIYRMIKEEHEQMDKGEVDIVLSHQEKVIEFEELIYTWTSEGVKRYKSSKKSVLTMMRDHEAEVEEFLKANKIGLKNIHDVIKLFNYYNSL